MTDLVISTPRKELGDRATARTSEADRFLKLGADWLLTCDSDQSIPIEGLSYFLSSDKSADIYVIDAPNKGEDDSNVRYHPDGSLAYFTISCCFIKRDVFEKIERPWFSSKFAFIERQPKGGKIVWEIQEKMYDDNIGEDVFFARKCIEAGVRIMVVPNVKSKHIQL